MNFKHSNNLIQQEIKKQQAQTKMEIVNRRRDRIYSFEDLYENVKEIVDKDLNFIIHGDKLLNPCVFGGTPIRSRFDFVCKLHGWHHNALVFKNNGQENQILQIYNIEGKLYTCGFINNLDTRIEIPDIFEVYREDDSE